MSHASPEPDPHDHPAAHRHHHGQEDHGHAHGLVDRSVLRSRAGVRTVAISLAVLATAAAIQLVIFWLSGSVALLADLVHNFGDALTAIPLAIAFVLRSARGERWAGLVIVSIIFVSAIITALEAINRLISPQHPSHLVALGFAGLVGVVANEIAAQVRLHGGRQINSAALIADGKHARVDGFVSAGVIASAIAVAVGVPTADPLIGLAISLVLLKITWDSWKVISQAGHEAIDGHDPHGTVHD